MVQSSRYSKLFAGIAIVIAASGVGIFIVKKYLLPVFFGPTESSIESVNINKESSGMPQISDELLQLDTPWEVGFTPEGDILVTERNGNLVRKIQDGSVIRMKVPGAVEIGEGGLLGMALHPDFADNRLVYLYFTTKAGNRYENRVVRYRLGDAALNEDKVVIKGIPGAQYHNGGRIAFGPDKMLYITTGDAGDSRNAQNKQSLGGKILRVKPDGAVPEDNPFKNAVWSYGHRNPQGLAWDENNRLWSTEHGRSGVATGFDEINLIQKGGNYGWPRIQGDEKADGMITPVANSGEKETWAPSGLAYADNRLFFAGLRGSSLYEARLTTDGGISLIRAFMHLEYGRLRAVAAHGKRLYITTSNRDGRGQPRDGDDRVLRVNIDLLQ